MLVSKTNYADNKTTRTQAFFLGEAPELTDPAIDHDYGGWGEEYVFQVVFSDPDYHAEGDNVSLWMSPDNVSWWLKDSKSVIGVEVTTQFFERFTCADQSKFPSGIRYWKIRAVDPFNYSDETPVFNLTLVEDNVTVTPQTGSSNSSVHRMGAEEAFLEFRVYDDDLEVYPNDTHAWVWITENYTNYSVLKYCNSTNGYCNVSWDPTCSAYAGVQRWIGGTNDTCYVDENSTYTNLTVIGQLYASPYDPESGEIINRNVTTQLNATIWDECEVYVANATVPWYDHLWNQIAEGYNTTWLIPSGFELGAETLHVNTTKTHYDEGTNSTSVYVYGWSSLTDIEPATGTEEEAGNTVVVTCTVKDANTDAPIPGYQVDFFKNGTAQETEGTDFNGEAEWQWNTNTENAGWYNISCRINDTMTMFYNTSVDVVYSLIRIRRPLIFEYITTTPGEIYRNDSFSPHESNITVKVVEAQAGPSNGANVTFYNQTYSLIDYCVTESTGICSILYNAVENKTPDIYTFYLNATKNTTEDSVTNTTSVKVQGILHANITEPVNGTVWTKGDIINLVTDIWDENGNDITSADVYWYNETGMVGQGISTTLNLKTQDTGWRNISNEVRKDCASFSTECYDRAGNYSIIKIHGLSSVKWVLPPKYDTPPWYGLTIDQVYNFTCNVYDEITSVGIPNYTTNVWYKYGSDPWAHVGAFQTDDDGNVTRPHLTETKGELQFRCNITGDDDKLYNASVSEVTATFDILDNVPPTITDYYISPNESIEANLNTTTVFATISDNIGIANAWISIEMPNGTFISQGLASYPDISNASLVSDQNYTNFTHSQNVTEPGEMKYYNITIYNNESEDVYFNISVEGTQIFTNLSAGSQTNTTVDLSGNFSFIAPTVFDILFEFGDVNGSSRYVEHQAWQKWLLESFRYNSTYNPPIGGWYNVTIYAQDLPPESNIESKYAGAFYVWGEANVTVGNYPKFEVAIGVTQTAGYEFLLVVNITNNGPPNAWNVSLNVSDTSANYTIYNETYFGSFTQYCGKIPANQSCKVPINISIKEKTPPNVIIVISNVTWRNPDNSWNETNATTEVEIAETPVIDILEEDLQGSAPHGEATLIGDLTVLSAGNSPVYDMEMIPVGGNLFYDCALCDLSMFPDEQGIMNAGTNISVNVTLDVPYGQSPGVYWTKIRANTSNAAYDEALFNITVPWNNTWIRWPSSFGTVLALLNTNGTVGNVTIQNLGNVMLYATTYKSGTGTTLVNTFPRTVGIPRLTIIHPQVQTDYSIPPTLAPGLYDVILSIRPVDEKGDPADPDVYTTTFTLNVTDLPPAIENISVEPQNFEVYYDTVGISAIITDNFAVAKAWVNITLPNGSYYFDFMSKNGDFYWTNFSTNKSGLYVLSICANDTRFLSGCAVPINMTANDETNLSFIPHSNLTIDDALWDRVTNFTLNYSLVNPLYSRAFNVTANYSVLEGWEVEPLGINVSLMLKESDYNDTLVIRVPNETLAGNYTFITAINWTNLNGTLGTNVTNFTLFVKEKALIYVEEEDINFTIINLNTKNDSFLVKSLGNIPAENTTVACVDGLVCGNMTVNITPTDLGDMYPGNATPVNVTVTVPELFETGLYLSHIHINATNTSDLVNLWVRVPLNVSWANIPEQITKELVQDESGEFGVIEVKNVGNVDANVTVNITGNITQFLSFNETYLEIPFEESKYVRINYTTPPTYTFDTYTGEFVTENTTADPSKKTSLLEMIVHPLRVNINDPTETDPIINVTNGSFVIVNISASYGYSVISSELELNATLRRNSTTEYDVNETFDYNSTEHLWYLNFTAPPLENNTGYDLIIIGNYTALNVGKIDVEDKAVIYSDELAPTVSLNLPRRTEINQTVMFYVNATDAGGVEFVEATVTFPSGGIIDYDMNRTKKDGDKYFFEYEFTGTQTNGSYGVTARACDYSGNCRSVTGTFGIFPYITFSGRSVDMEKPERPPLNTSFDFFDAGTPNWLDTVLTNESGNYSKRIEARNYDVEMNYSNISFKIYGILIDENVHNPIEVGVIPTSLIGTGSLRGTEIIVNNLDFNEYRIKFDYSEFEDISASNLGIYFCVDWKRYLGCPNNSWVRYNNTVVDGASEEVYTIQDEQDLKEAFTLAEFICGNDICETSYGESDANCPQDCAGGAPGGGEAEAGGGGGGAGAGAVVPGPAGAGVPSEELAPIPIEFKAPVIDITVYPGESKVFGVEVTNNMANETSGTIYAEGPVWILLEFQVDNFTIANKSTKTIQVKVTPSGNTTPGVYTGDIVLEVAGITHRIPASVAVEILQEPLLDVTVSVLTKYVRPGEDLKFEVNLINMGGTESVEDIIANYSIYSLEGKETLVTLASETVAVDNLHKYVREVAMPEDAPAGRYMVEVIATYWYGRKYALSTDSFDVIVEPAPIVAIRRIFSWWFTWVLLLLVAPAGYFGYKYYIKWKGRKQEKQRYTLPLDMDELPKAGPSSVKVGKLAGTDIDSLFDLDDLTTHAIVAGATGSGKSVSAQVITEEALLQKKAVIAFDPTAQWSGFLAPCRDKKMLRAYPKFSMTEEDSRPFKGLIFEITDPAQIETIDFKDWIRPGEITVFTVNKLTTKQFDAAIRAVIATFFEQTWEESSGLEVIIIFDEVHRLLEKYGGLGGYVSLEKAAREFRKWGLGMIMISQVLSDFKEAVKGNVLTELQMHSKGADVERVRSKYGDDFAARLLRQEVGVGFLQNPKYNRGKPWFVNFRPLLHSPHKLLEEELETYKRLGSIIWKIRDKIKDMKAKGKDAGDLELELKLAEDKLKTGAFRMAEIYLEGLRKRAGVSETAPAEKPKTKAAEASEGEPEEGGEEAPGEEKTEEAPVEEAAKPKKAIKPKKTKAKKKKKAQKTKKKKVKKK